jgi:uncharacterized protein
MNDPTYHRLTEHLRSLGGVVVAFSGGVDSSLLLAAAADALAKNAVAVTVDSPVHPARELAAARALARELGVRHLVIHTDELADDQFRANPPRRCYFCKSRRFRALVELAREEGMTQVIEGGNLDDLGDYRPGMDAVRELGIRSPLIELSVGKAQIRALARARGLAVWDRPAAACLASRIPYGQPITPEKLRRIERAEEALQDLGFRIARGRDHGEVARVEIDAAEFGRLADAELRARLAAAMRSAGYAYAALDLEGYRRGSLNETLPHED